MICFQCGKYGHSKEGCKEICTDCPSRVGGSVNNPGSIPTLMDRGTEMEIERGSFLDDANGSRNLGPWMHALKHGRRKPNKENALERKPLDEKAGKPIDTSRFGLLVDLEE